MIEETIMDQKLQFHTSSRLFSPEAVDKGTLAMLSEAPVSMKDKVLDLGCGYGAAGIYMGKMIGEDRIIMCDISEEAVKLAGQNAVLNGLPGIRVMLSNGLRSLPDSDFTLILSNPPYHTDFSVAKSFIKEGFLKLSMGGRMIMVTKRLDWYKNRLISVFGGVHVTEKDGYYIFTAEKRSRTLPLRIAKAPKLSKKLQRKSDKAVPHENQCITHIKKSRLTP